MLLGGFLCSLLLIPTYGIIYLMLDGERKLIGMKLQKLTADTVGAAIQEKIGADVEPNYQLLRFDLLTFKDIDKLRRSLFGVLNTQQLDELTERLKQLSRSPSSKRTDITRVIDELMESYNRVFILSPDPSHPTIDKDIQND